MKPLVVASECCAGLYPQNTLPGFEFCIASGVDGIEFDVHLSADGQVVVQHDYRLNQRITRSTTGAWLDRKGPALRELTLAEIKQFDVGTYHADSHEAATYPDYQPMDGVGIPTLESFLQAYVNAGSQATLWIELKTTPFDRQVSSDPATLLAAVLSLVAQYNVTAKTVLLAFEWQLLLDAKAACHDVRTDFLTINPAFIHRLYKRKGAVRPEEMYQPLDPASHEGSLPKTISAAGGEWWGPYIADVTAADVAIAHDCKLQVNLWGVDSTEEAIDHALSLGADAITISNSLMLQHSLLPG